MRSTLRKPAAEAYRRLTAAATMLACAGLATPLLAAPLPQEAPPTEEGEQAAERGGRGLVRGMLRTRYIARWTPDDSDNDLVSILSLDIGDPDEHDFTAHLFGRLTWDMDGLDDTFASINDSYGSSLDGLLYDAYVDVHCFEDLSLLRVGRQSVDETPVITYFDGAHATTSAFDWAELQVGAYAGATTHFYEASPSGDFVAGAYATAKPWKGGKLRLDFMHLEDETRLLSHDDNLLGASVWQSFSRELRAEAEYTRLGSDDRDVRVRAHYHNSKHDLFVRGSYYKLLTTQGDLVLEADPFYNALNELRPYGQYSLMAAKGLGESLRLQAAADLRRVDDTADIGFYNRDYDHYYGTAYLFDFGIEDVSVSGTFDVWDSDGQDIESWGADLNYECCEDSTLSLGTYYSLYKFDLFSNTERDHVRTYFFRFRHKATETVTLESDYEFEDDDYDEYHRFRLGVTWRF